VIKVLIVDDSPTVREYLVHVLDSDPAIEVVGSADDGEAAVELARKLKPDVITMDMYMPVMSGIEATRRIMESDPIPIVIVSGVWDPKEVETTFRAIEAGALAVVQRPGGAGSPEGEDATKELISKVKLMSEVKVVKRWPRPARLESRDRPSPAVPVGSPHRIAVVAIGASTGGPLAIRTILSGLPSHFPIPILIVQHIASGFIGGMIEWLSETTRLSLHEARDGEMALAGHVYFAPDGREMGMRKDGVIYLSRGGRSPTMPSVSHLFRSILDAYGEAAAGVLLTGMGRDGAEELKALKEKGALTIAQDKESSVVFGMPGEAIKINGASLVLPPQHIAGVLATLKSVKRETA
jgi:two-component system chemotaxis response regulator CheB